MPRALISQTQVPVTAMACETLAATVYILVGDFAALLLFIAFHYCMKRLLISLD